MSAEQASKFSVSMTGSDMRMVDQIADKLGLSRSELVRQAVVDFAKAKGILTEYSPSTSTPPGALEWILTKSHGVFGDFKMPICSALIVEHGLAGELSDEQLSTILKRYKEHVTYWSSDDSIVRKELSDFAAAAEIPLPRVMKIFYAS